MADQNYITAYAKIRAGKVILNGETGYSANTEEPAADFVKAAYKHYEFNYPKFYKMDQLCRLAFVCSELLLRANKITANYATGDIAIIVANNAASLEIDTEHQSTIADANNYFPSPAVFVYTLPNILIGEIAIRNSIKGENTFFIFDTFDARFMNSYIQSVLNTGKAKCCIAGWVDFYENKYDAFLYTVEQTNKGLGIVHTEEQLNNLYK